MYIIYIYTYIYMSCHVYNKYNIQLYVVVACLLSSCCGWQRSFTPSASTAGWACQASRRNMHAPTSATKALHSSMPRTHS